MAYTGQLGTNDSMPGNILLGGSGLSNVYNVSSDLVITQVVIKNNEISVSNTLTFTQQAMPRVFFLSVSNDLTITQTALTDAEKSRRVFANLFPTQTVAREVIYERSVNHSLTVTHELKRVYAFSVSNTLTPTQDILGINSKYVTSTVTLTQSVSVQKTIVRALSTTLPLVDTTLLNKSLQVQASNPLALQQAQARTKVRLEDVESTLTLTDEVVRLKIFAAASSLADLAHSVTVQRVLNRTASNILVPTQTLARLVSYNRSLDNTLVFKKERVRRIRIGGLTEVTFPEVVGRSVRGITADCGEINYRTIVLQAGGRNVTLPRPEYGDREAGTGSFTLSHSMTGVQRTTVKRSDTEVLNWTFDVRYDKFKEVADFLFTANTEAFIIDDHKGRMWVGKLLSNPITFTDVREPLRCQSKVTFALDFEALRLS